MPFYGRIRSWRALGISTLALVLSAGSAVSCAGTQEKKTKSGEEKGPSAVKYYEIAVGSFHNGMTEDAKIQMIVSVADRKQMDRVMSRIKKLSGVRDVVRILS